MKITSVDIIRFPLNENCSQTPVLCRINTDEGIYGYGEAGVSINNFSLGCIELLRSFGKMIIGMDPLNSDFIYHKLANTFWAIGNGGVIFAAISAIDVALWDIKGKYFHVPVYVLLGGKHRDKLRCYASQLQNGWKDPNFLHTPGDLGYIRDACERALADGYDAIKIDFITQRLDGRPVNRFKMKNYIEREEMKDFEARLDMVRSTIGSDVDLILENHCITSANTAIQFGKLAENYDPMFLEEPVSPLNVQDYVKISERLQIPLATGERVYTKSGFLPLLESYSLDVIQPDISNCGGLSETRKICDMAHAFGVTVQTHACNTPISIAASLHLEAAIPNFIIHEHHTSNTLPAVTDCCVYNYQPVDGYFLVPELPGLGNELTEEALKTADIFTVK